MKSRYALLGTLGLVASMSAAAASLDFGSYVLDYDGTTAFGGRLPCAAGQLLDDGIVHVFENLVDRFGLVVMRVDVDDRKILVAALGRLLGGMREKFRGVEFLDRHFAEV